MAHIYPGRTTVHAASEGDKFNADTSLHVVACPTCGILHALPESLYQAARKYNRATEPRNYWEISCPLGHSWHYTGLNREQDLERKLQVQRDRAGRLAHQRDQAEASRRAQKGAATRARNERDRIASRAKAGVCPCCNRTFKQLARHMKGQHPDYDPAA